MNRWATWMFEMPQDAEAWIKEGRKLNRRKKGYDNPQNCPKPKLSGKDEDSGGRFTGWRFREANAEMKKQLAFVKEDWQKHMDVEAKYVETCKKLWKELQGFFQEAELQASWLLQWQT